jgi:hypothetical protein
MTLPIGWIIKTFWSQTLAAVVSGYIAWQTCAYFAQKNLNATISEIRTIERQNCQIAKSITNRTENDLNKALDIVIAQRNALVERLRREGTPSGYLAQPSSKDDGTAQTDPVPTIAVSVDSLAEAQMNTNKLLACQGFIIELYEVNDVPLK